MNFFCLVHSSIGREESINLFKEIVESQLPLFLADLYFADELHNEQERKARDGWMGVTLTWQCPDGDKMSQELDRIVLLGQVQKHLTVY